MQYNTVNFERRLHLWDVRFSAFLLLCIEILFFQKQWKILKRKRNDNT